VKVFAGHEAGVLHACTNAYGNLIVSGGRDSNIKFWDAMSGVCVKTLRQNGAWGMELNDVVFISVVEIEHVW
ncbi:unnamed protein product, partial [Choristocarpus tenellus]